MIAALKHNRQLQQLLDKYGVTYLALFGSRSRGDQQKKSDYDFLIELEQPLGLKFFRLEQEVSRILQTKVDLVTRDSLNRYIKPHVEKDLQVIYKKN